MAKFRRGQRHKIARLFVSILGVLAITWWKPDAKAQALYERPVLITDLDMHSSIARGAIDAEARFLVTGSYDKTLRIWSAAEGKLLRTIRIPSGPGNIGIIYTVAISPDGEEVAAGGWTDSNSEFVIYLFERGSGKLTKRIGGLPNVILKLTYSGDGRYLAAGLGNGRGLRVFGRDRDWSEIFRDTNYRDDIYGIDFVAGERLATSSYDGKIRLYDGSFNLIAASVAPSGQRPKFIAFNSNGTALAVGYDDAAAVDILDGRNLARLAGPDVNGLGNSKLDHVTWSADGRTLFAAGTYWIEMMDS